jgi:hypothetical protein
LNLSTFLGTVNLAKSPAPGPDPPDDDVDRDDATVKIVICFDQYAW